MPQLEQIVRAWLASAKAGLQPDATPDVVTANASTFPAMEVSLISGDALRVLDICRCVDDATLGQCDVKC